MNWQEAVRLFLLHHPPRPDPPCSEISCLQQCKSKTHSINKWKKSSSVCWAKTGLTLSESALMSSIFRLRTRSASQTFNVISSLKAWTNNLEQRHALDLLVFPTHHIKGYLQKKKKYNADWGQFACMLQFDCTSTPMWDAERFLSCVTNLQSWKRQRDEVKAITVPQVQGGRIILYSSVTSSDSTLIGRVCTGWWYV